LKRLLVLGFLLLCLGKAGAEIKSFPPAGPCASATPAPQATVGVNDVTYTATALTTTAYATMASPTLTLGTSTGTLGSWIVEVLFYISSTTSTVYYPCIAGTNAGTSAVFSGAACGQALTNSLVGSGSNAASNLSAIPSAYYSATYANGATVAFTCAIYDVGTSKTATGHCIERAFPI
jgi:hypothetical protein